jgi:hypothetical protein
MFPNHNIQRRTWNSQPTFLIVCKSQINDLERKWSWGPHDMTKRRQLAVHGNVPYGQTKHQIFWRRIFLLKQKIKFVTLHKLNSVQVYLKKLDDNLPPKNRDFADCFDVRYIVILYNILRSVTIICWAVQKKVKPTRNIR